MADKAKDPAVEKSGGSRSRIMLLAAIGLVVLLGAGAAGAYFMGMFAATASAASTGGTVPAEGHEVEHAALADGEHEAVDGPEPGTPGPPEIIFVNLPDVLVNLNADIRRMRFLKLRLAVEVSSQAAADKVNQLTPRIMDSFQVYLRGLTVDDLVGAASLHRLKLEMLARINLALEPSRIDDVLVKEMLVQ
jgi:flagellar protein FliL